MFKKTAITFSVLFFALVLSLWFFLTSETPERSPQALRECDPRETAERVFAQQRLPTPILYRYGRKKTVEENVLADTIPVEDWNRFVVGEGTRYFLKPFRRGLYGTEVLDTADQFAEKEYPALSAIILKKECIHKDRVETVWNLPENQRFQKWYSATRRSLSLKQWSELCFEERGEPRKDQFNFYESKIAEQTTCESIVNQYFNDENIALVQDSVVQRSWAIRDRTCIDHIRGGAEYWVDAFSTQSELWNNACLRNINHRNRVRVWFEALAQSKASPSHLPHWSKQVQNLVAPLPMMDPSTRDLDDFSVQGFAKSFDEAKARCVAARKEQEFKDRLSGIADAVESLQTTDVRNELERACR